MDLQNTKKLVVGTMVVALLSVVVINTRPAVAGWNATGLVNNEEAETSLEDSTADEYFEEDPDGDDDSAQSWAEFEFVEDFPGQPSEQNFVHYRTRQAPAWVTTLTPVGDQGEARVTADFDDGTGIHTKFVQLGGEDDSVLTLANAEDIAHIGNGVPNNTVAKFYFPYTVEITTYAFYDFNPGSNGVAYAQAQGKSTSMGTAKQ